ncbi:hypothetical protein [Geothrix sp. 21YS21S-2]|uniref:hypothetical protein n=1 Tax=Geothrix sp. 21YS21S-2 TaxID=3068893 RepID=UPI0027B955A2|nr:hypothetical protein [Geothrix sp. 21YS21S-2]
MDFLSFREFLETLQVPDGREATYKDFRVWFRRHSRSAPEFDVHRLHEDFKGVLTGYPVDRPWLDREAYLGLGVRQSILPEAQRAKVFDLFEKYLAFQGEARLFEPNIVAHGHLPVCQARCDLAALLLKTLHKAGRFIRCRDSNQIVHPNFFSWAHIKSFFFEHGDLASRDITRILQAKYRNTPQVTNLANRLLHRTAGPVPHALGAEDGSREDQAGCGVGRESCRGTCPAPLPGRRKVASVPP